MGKRPGSICPRVFGGFPAVCGGNPRGGCICKEAAEAIRAAESGASAGADEPGRLQSVRLRQAVPAGREGLRRGVPVCRAFVRPQEDWAAE